MYIIRTMKNHNDFDFGQNSMWICASETFTVDGEIKTNKQISGMRDNISAADKQRIDEIFSKI